MKKPDIINLTVLLVVLLAIFYPVFYSEYLYTDESVWLWDYKKLSQMQAFTGQGRFITEKLFDWLFGSINSIKAVSYLRLFSLFGWVLCIPIWYFTIKKIVLREQLPPQLTFFTVLYLISTPSFAISIGWASCLELFLANTAGLVAGYVLYNAIKFEKQIINLSTIHIIFVITIGLISLFTYQSGFGCFLIPFLLHFINNKIKTRTLIIGIFIYLITYIIYFLIFKYNIKVDQLVASDRTGLHIDPWGKLKFLFKQPLASAFHFTFLFNEKSKFGILIYRILLLVIGGVAIYKLKKASYIHRIQYLVIIFLFFILAYIPSLVVKENYASNRTLIALNTIVFIFVAAILLDIFKKDFTKNIFIYSISFLFVINAWYNFNYLFLKPITHEYSAIRSYLKENYSPEVNTISFVRPPEDLFVQKFGITRSWDEFGVPSTHFNWVPEPLVKQIIYEITGNRAIADKLIIKHSLQKADSMAPTSKAELLLNATDIISKR